MLSSLVLLLFLWNGSCQKWVCWLVGWLVFNDFWNFLFRPFVKRFLKGCFVSWGIVRHGTGVPQSLWREERERIAAGRNFLFPLHTLLSPHSCLQTPRSWFMHERIQPILAHDYLLRGPHTPTSVVERWIPMCSLWEMSFENLAVVMKSEAWRSILWDTTSDGPGAWNEGEKKSRYLIYLEEDLQHSLEEFGNLASCLMGAAKLSQICTTSASKEAFCAHWKKAFTVHLTLIFWDWQIVSLDSRDLTWRPTMGFISFSWQRVLLKGKEVLQRWSGSPNWQQALHCIHFW